MITDIALILLVALILNSLFIKLNLPGILGMIATGIILGPSFLNLIHPEVIELLKEFKTAALIVILIRAGLGINKETLKKVGAPAIKMSFIPGIIEGTTILFVSHFLLDFSIVEAGILGFIVAAVSPAVVVPAMLALKEHGYGKKKEIPTLVLAGASLDDVFAITIFGVFLGLASGNSTSISHLIFSVPVGIVLGALIGIVIGFGLIWYFKKFHIRDTKKVIIFMIVSIVFYELTEMQEVKNVLPIAGLLGIMGIGFIILEKYGVLANRLALKFAKVWVLAEILLFVYIGSAVQINTVQASVIGVGLLILAIGLIARSIGVWISLIGSKLNLKEKLFCMIAYIPKATVQAAIGAVPLALIYDGSITTINEQTGQIILAIAVLSIVVTAPLGAIGIKLSSSKLLDK
ncbi:MAG: cation:proton antiporter [Salinivirgaceae bacterium]|jgi:NhaP-type Na+/H+ or K+/H+ antiporter|nr:cation:proton antiporter [Salinivirgaceae bacterium]